MPDRRIARAWRRTEARLWTGPVGHLVGGALDVLAALLRHGAARARDRIAAR